MNLFPDLRRQKFHWIVYNFPHAGFHPKENHPVLIAMHRQLVCGFFRNARSMLWLDGEVHVSHKITVPFKNWKLEDLAAQCSLHFFACDDFNIHDYTGHCNKGGAGSRCDKPFLLGECKTFKFKIYPDAKNIPKTMHGISQNLHVPPINVPVPYVKQLPLRPLTFNDARFYNGPMIPSVNMTNERPRMFGGYLNYGEEILFLNSVHEALRLGYNRYMGKVSERSLSGYIDILKKIQQSSIVRLEQLSQMVLRLDQQF